jgi:hypothetical protein
VLFTNVVDIDTAGFEDPQAEQSEHRDQREIEPVLRVPGGGQQRLELQVRQAQRW